MSGVSLARARAESLPPCTNHRLWNRAGISLKAWRESLGEIESLPTLRRAGTGIGQHAVLVERPYLVIFGAIRLRNLGENMPGRSGVLELAITLSQPLNASWVILGGSSPS